MVAARVHHPRDVGHVDHLSCLLDANPAYPLACSQACLHHYAQVGVSRRACPKQTYPNWAYLNWAYLTLACQLRTAPIRIYLVGGDHRAWNQNREIHPFVNRPRSDRAHSNFAHSNYEEHVHQTWNRKPWLQPFMQT